MKKIFLLLLCCVVISGCGEKVDNQVKTSAVETLVNDDPQEFSFADLQEICDWVNDETLKRIESLSEAEYTGLSTDEEEKIKHRRKIQDKYVNEVMTNCKIPQGEKVIVTGYIGNCHQIVEGTWTEDIGKVAFELKHNENDEDWDGIFCRTDDLSFLEIEENTPIKIEAVFMKQGTSTGGGENLFDCSIIEK